MSYVRLLAILCFLTCCSCFPYVVNIAVQAIIKELKDKPSTPVLATAPNPSMPSEELVKYANALSSDPVGMVRNIVAICRKSGQRREQLKALIAEGNEKGFHHLPPLQLLRDCITRWSSTYNMIDRGILLYPVSFFFIKPVTHCGNIW